MSQSCNTNHCPVNGGWNEWSPWSICTKTVSGIQIRFRECSNPEPAYGGEHCNGSRAHLRECNKMSSCYEVFPLRFKTESNPSVGTMEIHTNRSWEKLCTSTWNKVEIDLTCMAMGYSNSSDYGRWYEDRGNVSETSTNFNCTTTLTKCEESFSNKLQFCKVPVRLNGANVEYGGRVEVFYKGRWGKICTNGWDFNDAQVICRQLGFEEALAEFIGSNVEDGNITSVMVDVSCNGEEVELASCARTDGKLNVPGQCRGDGKGSQALCQPKNKEVLGKENLYFDIGSNEILHCSIRNKTSFARWVINGQKVQGMNSSSKRVKTTEDGKLVIENVQLSDGGTYECLRLEYVQYYTVYINARFTENTRDQQSLTAYTSGTINCGAEGTPRPQVTWRKQGEKLVLNGRRFTQILSGSLQIDPVHPEDSGTYRCTMTQNKGSKRVTSRHKSINVSVIVRPEVKISGASNLIREGDTVTLTCKIIQGQPQPQITWLKNNLSEGHNMSLSFHKITQKDTGLYTCEAKNPGGISAENIYISVKVSPQIKLSPINQSVIDGDSVNFTCRATGVPTPNLTWTFNDGKLPSGTKENNLEGDSFVELFLEMQKITKKMEGIYKCTAKNKANTTSSSTTLHVFEKPTAQITPNSQLILATDDELTLACSVNEATVNITWKKDGDPIKERADIDTQLNKKTSYLVIAKVVEEDSGKYSCEARNRLRYMARSTVTIEVKRPPHLNPELKNRSVPLNSTLETDCFKRGDPPISVNWTKDGKALSRNNTLVIKRVTFDDGGFYECAAENQVGKVNISFWIDVTVCPQIKLSPVNQSVIDGDPVNFTCRATGVPTPKLTWTFNGGRLPLGINENNFKGESFQESFLKIQRATKKMEGTYKCTAKNKANGTSYSTILQVFEKPTAKVTPKPYPTLTQGDKLRLTCSVNKATVNITWKKDGDPVKERAVIKTQLDETTSYLIIAKVVEEDSGEYSCEARNRVGNVARSIVMIKVNPVSPFLVWYYIFGSMAAVIVILLMGCYFWKRRRTAAATALPDQGESVEMELLNVEVDEWEIEVNRVLLQDVIGRGAFGAVWRALLSSPNGRPGNRTVAAKCFTPTAGEEGRKCLMREIELGKILGDSNQPNIVKFIGCVTRQVHPILIMEHLPCGDLLGYMRKCRGINDRYYLGEGRPQVLNNYDLVLFAKQIAAGMVFLGSRGIIHRDLAARNVLLDNNYVCKVTDFGMAYQSFKYGHGNAKKGCLPIKWTAPEILLGNFAGLSTLSDVWSYGIVLYEIVTIGGIPYEGWSEGNVVARVTHGYKLPKPDHVDDKLYAIMERCWNFDPDFRPPFESLRKRMNTYLREETYLQLLDMGSYDTTKYSKVEDLGGADAEPSARPLSNAAAKRLGKWASDRR
ncbi:fibroblast growth factor receptor 4-like isoform X2 [Pocillopora verrucosa]|uniref:fibroblast growth factor receptor 4-like isoform X2 n=1 Tax=Pocillopora verrucosa TaxID=203993 RepID=UPI00333E75AD